MSVLAASAMQDTGRLIQEQVFTPSHISTRFWGRCTAIIHRYWGEENDEWNEQGVLGEFPVEVVEEV